MHERDARAPERMRLYGGRVRHRINLNAEFGRGFLQFIGVSLAEDERAAIEFLPGGLERFFGSENVRFFQAVAQRDERVVGVVVDEIS